jgi:hypothetical protein
LNLPLIDTLCCLLAIAMPITSAIFNAHPDRVNSLLTDIEEQFTLDENALVSITSHFHKLFNLGLSEYGHPMAMMCDFSSAFTSCTVLTSKFKSYIRHGCTGRYRNWVTFQIVTSTANVPNRQITARSSHLILAEPICK